MDFGSTLQYLCIKEIALEFDKFCAFKNSNVAHLQRKLKFLKTVYPYEILSELKWMDDLKERHIDVLVNKYIKVLHTNWFKNVPWKKVTRKFDEVGSNIKHITFDNYEERRPWKNIFHCLSNLETMFFTDYCSDEILKCLAQFCPNIMNIIVSNSHVTNEGIKYLCMKENGKPLCPKLKTVLISNSGVDFEGVRYLVRNLKSLEETDHRGLVRVILQSQFANYFSGLHKEEPYNLKCLELHPDYSDIHSPTYMNLSNEICLTLCPRLKSLSCLIEKKEHLNLFPYELEELNLKFSSELKINITNFLKYKGRTLTILVLTNCLLSVGTLAKSCPCLIQLEMEKVHFTYDKFSPVFPHLEMCTFKDTINETATVKSICLVLTASPKLWRISFETCNLSSRALNGEILKACKYHPRKEVYFTSSAVGMDFAKEFIKDCHTLQVFELKDCDVNKKDAVEFVSYAHSLRKCRVVFDDIDKEDKVDFRAKLYGEITQFVFHKST